jgi:hypothetical protein
VDLDEIFKPARGSPSSRKKSVKKNETKQVEQQRCVHVCACVCMYVHVHARVRMCVHVLEFDVFQECAQP